jgi:hypothetical protein
LTFTPTVNGNGAATITVTVNNGGTSNNLVAQQFTVTVNVSNNLLTNNPTIQAPPSSLTAETGTTVGFGVQAAGEAPLTFQWFFNSTDAISNVTTNSSVTLPNVQFSQSGAYTVVVTNVAGAVTSSPAMLNVIAPVGRKSVPAINLMGQVGDSLGLDCADSYGPSLNWETITTMTLTNTSQIYVDLSAPCPSPRFYRVWRSGGAGDLPTLQLYMIPEITLTGDVGSTLRLDYINTYGPTNAWETLTTVTLTNTTQFYCDVSVIGQPQRLYRIVPVP